MKASGVVAWMWLFRAGADGLRDTLFEDAAGIRTLSAGDVASLAERGEVGGEGRRPWVVNFYAPWCGHCREYAETWRAVGRYVSSRQMSEESRPQLGVVSCATWRDACAAQGVEAYPTLKAFGTLGDGVVVEGREVRDVAEFAAARLGPEASEALLAGLGAAEGVRPEARVAEVRATGASLADAAASLRYALETAVFARGGDDDRLPASRLVALRGFLAALSVALPSLEAPNRLLPRVADEAPLSRREWLDLVRRDPQPPWTEACDPGLDGNAAAYTCGLWVLFHSLAARSVDDGRGLASAAASAAVRAFVDHFFACRACRDHFLAMYDDCEHGRCDDPRTLFPGATDADRLVLWLWRAHNAVNARVKARLDPAAVDLDDPAPPWAYPDAALCASCRDPRSTRWRPRDLLAFLRRTYAAGPARRSNAAARRRPAPSRPNLLLLLFLLAAAALLLVLSCGRLRAAILRPRGLTPRRAHRASPPGFGSNSPPNHWASSSTTSKKQRVLADAL